MATPEIPKRANGQSDWVAYRLLVLDKLEALDKAKDEAALDRDHIKGQQVKIRLELKALQTKATIWGAVAGTIASALLSAALALLSKFVF